MIATLAPGGCERALPPTPLDAGRLGQAQLYAPKSHPKGFVFLFSDAGGPTPELEQTAQALARDGSACLLVDLGAYLRGLAASDDGCHYVVSELEDLSKRQQRELGATHYHSPVLAGVGQGGTLAYAALAQAPSATIAGAVALRPADRLATRVPLCEGAPASGSAAGGGFHYAASHHDLPGLYRMAEDVSSGLVTAIDALQRDHGDTTKASGLAALPLVRLSAARPGPLVAVIYSGDGGWRDLDKTIGEYLARNGVPTIGVDSLRYFWRRKSPDEVAADLVQILEAELAQGDPSRGAVLIGYSFGAGVLPFAWNRLPEHLREHVVQVSLLGLGSTAPFEFHLTNWLDEPDPSGLPVLPEVERMDLSRVQCFYGEGEKDTLCPTPALAGAEVIRTTGSHHFDGNYSGLAQRILDGALRRTSPQRATTPATPPEISAATSASTKAAASPPGAAR